MARKRVVRKQPLYEKLKLYPFDFLLWLHEESLAVDWESYSDAAFSGGLCALLAFVALCKAAGHLAQAQERTANAVFLIDAAKYAEVRGLAIHGSGYSVAPPPPQTPAAGRRTLVALHGALLVSFGVALFNQVRLLYFQLRTYTLLYSSTAPRALSVVRHSISSAVPRGVLSRVFSFFEERSLYETDSESEGPETPHKDVWAMHVWDPLLFLLRLAAAFSPVTLALVWLVAAPWYQLVVMAVGFAALLDHVAARFLALVADKQIIFQETFAEYNKKYVVPKTVVLRKNASVDATRGARARAADVVHDSERHLQNELAFSTHDIHGNRLRSVRADTQPVLAGVGSRAGSVANSRAASPARASPTRLSPTRDEWVQSTPYGRQTPRLTQSARTHLTPSRLFYERLVERLVERLADRLHLERLYGRRASPERTRHFLDGRLPLPTRRPFR